MDIPLKRAQTPASHNKKIRPHSFHLETDYLLRISLLDPSFTAYLNDQKVKRQPDKT